MKYKDKKENKHQSQNNRNTIMMVNIDVRKVISKSLTLTSLIVEVEW